MPHSDTKDPVGFRRSGIRVGEKSRFPGFFSRAPLHASHPALIHYSSTPLFRLECDCATYAHLLKKKDVEYISPLVDYFIGKSGHAVYLGGEAVKNLYFHGRKSYKTLTMLAILTSEEVDRYAWIMNNVISSNDGAFSLGMKYTVRKNRQAGCFKDIAHARYIIEPRLEGLEKLLYPLRSSTLELDLTTQVMFANSFGIEIGWTS